MCTNYTFLQSAMNFFRQGNIHIDIFKNHSFFRGKNKGVFCEHLKVLKCTYILWTLPCIICTIVVLNIFKMKFLISFPTMCSFYFKQKVFLTMSLNTISMKVSDCCAMTIICFTMFMSFNTKRKHSITSPKTKTYNTTSHLHSIALCIVYQQMAVDNHPHAKTFSREISCVSFELHSFTFINL